MMSMLEKERRESMEEHGEGVLRDMIHAEVDSAMCQRWHCEPGDGDKGEGPRMKYDPFHHFGHHRGGADGG